MCASLFKWRSKKEDMDSNVVVAVVNCFEDLIGLTFGVVI